jgi:hypothetical protein
LKFYPGFIVDDDESPSTPAKLESAWQKFFDGARKTTYRPPGVYGGLIFRRAMNLYYKNENVRPTNPANPNDPNYDWSGLDAAFNINAVQNEGALLVLSIGFNTWGSTPSLPKWLINAPYDALWIRGTGGSMPKLYRYVGPDERGLTNRGTSPYVVDELLMFVQAMHDHLVATGNINKVMFVWGWEMEPVTPYPADYVKADFYHGLGLLNSGVAKIFAKSNIYVTASSMTGDSAGLDIRWQYMNNPLVGMNFPDMKLDNTVLAKLTSAIRFNDRNGVYQKDIRPLEQQTEANGQRPNIYFDPAIPNPWGYSATTTKETYSHIVWALSGSPKATDPAKRDSKLGQVGEDPPGIMPVHDLVVIWGNTYGVNAPTIDEVHKAIDTFGPPGTFAFPYFPPGYNP